MCDPPRTDLCIRDPATAFCRQPSPLESMATTTESACGRSRVLRGLETIMPPDTRNGRQHRTRLNVSTIELYGQVDAGTLQALGIMQEMDTPQSPGECRTCQASRRCCHVCSNYCAIFVEAVRLGFGQRSHWEASFNTDAIRTFWTRFQLPIALFAQSVGKRRNVHSVM